MLVLLRDETGGSPLSESYVDPEQWSIWISEMSARIKTICLATHAETPKPQGNIRSEDNASGILSQRSYQNNWLMVLFRYYCSVIMSLLFQEGPGEFQNFLSVN